MRRRKPHRLTLCFLPPDLFPDVVAARRFVAGDAYAAVAEAVQTCLVPEERQGLPGDALEAAFFAAGDLAALARAALLPEGAPLAAEWEAGWDLHQSPERIHELHAAELAADLRPTSDAPLRELFRHALRWAGGAYHA